MTIQQNAAGYMPTTCTAGNALYLFFIEVMVREKCMTQTKKNITIIHEVTVYPRMSGCLCFWPSLLLSFLHENMKSDDLKFNYFFAGLSVEINN